MDFRIFLGHIFQAENLSKIQRFAHVGNLSSLPFALRGQYGRSITHRVGAFHIIVEIERGRM